MVVADVLFRKHARDAIIRGKTNFANFKDFIYKDKSYEFE